MQAHTHRLWHLKSTNSEKFAWCLESWVRTHFHTFSSICVYQCGHPSSSSIWFCLNTECKSGLPFTAFIFTSFDFNAMTKAERPRVTYAGDYINLNIMLQFSFVAITFGTLMDMALKCKVNTNTESCFYFLKVWGSFCSPLQRPAPQLSAGQIQPLLESWQPSSGRYLLLHHPPSVQPTASHPLTFQ